MKISNRSDPVGIQSTPINKNFGQRIIQSRKNAISPVIIKRDLLAQRESPIMVHNESEHASQRTRTQTPMRSQSLAPGYNDKDDERRIDIISSLGMSEARSRTNIDGHQIESHDAVEEESSPVKVIANRKSSPNVFKGFEEFEPTFGTLEEEKDSPSNQTKSVLKHVDMRTERNNDSMSFLNQNTSTINATRVFITNGPRPKTDIDISEIGKSEEEDHDPDISIEKFQPHIKLTKLDSINEE